MSIRNKFLLASVALLLFMGFVAPSSALAAPLLAAVRRTIDGAAGQGVGYGTSVQLDAYQRPVIAYTDLAGTALKLAYCNNPVCSTWVINKVDDAGTGNHPSLRLTADGLPVISYERGGLLYAAFCGTPACEPGTTTIKTLDSRAGITAPYTSMQLDANGRPIVSYSRPASSGFGGMWVAYCNDVDCESVSLKQLESGAATSSTSMQLNSSGNPVIAYSSAAGSRGAALIVCTAPDCSTFDPVVPLHAASQTGQYISLQLDGADRPRAVYFWNSGGIRIALCDDAACSSLTTVSFSGTSTTSYTSLALDASGRPVFTSANPDSSVLSLTRCSNATCSSSTTSTLHSVRTLRSSLVLDCANNPVVSYHNSTFSPSTNYLRLYIDNASTCAASAVPQFKSSLVAPGPLEFSGVTGSSPQLSIDIRNGVYLTDLDVDFASITPGYSIVSGLPIDDLSSEDPAATLAVQCDSAPRAPGTLVLSTNDPAQPTVSYDLTCVELVPEFSASPAAPGLLALTGLVASTPQLTIEVTNAGDAGSLLDVSETSISSGYSIVSGLDIDDLAEGDSATITVECSVPQAAGTLVLSTNDPAQPTVSYDLICVELEAQFNGAPAAPGPLAFTGATASTPQLTIDVSNTGAAGSQLDVSLATISSGYSIVSGLPIAGLLDGDPAVPITVQCDSVSQEAGTLELATNDNAHPTLVYNLSCKDPTSGSTASTPISPGGVTSLRLGRLLVSLNVHALPPGKTGCAIVAEEVGISGVYGFALDDAVFDIKIVCDDGQVNILYAPATVCIQPQDGIVRNKQVFHNHNGGGFAPLAAGSGPASYVCGETRIFSLFTLGEASLPATGFAPGRVSVLAEQPAEAAYHATALSLSIPKLGVELDIVGVPQSPNGWDVSWLGQGQAGYLYGTSYPTWEGNSVLTAHVWNADNTAGSFYALKSLQYGDRFTVTAFGRSYVYEVRSNQLVLPSSLRPLADSDYSLITLITCESYSEAADGYLYRRAVQAVLVAVK